MGRYAVSKLFLKKKRARKHKKTRARIRIGMRKSFCMCVTAVITAFIAAVGLCIKALRAPIAVADFQDGNMRIVIDAGHGGVDGGVVGKRTGVKESDLNLEIAYLLKDELTDMGFDVALTRKTDAGLYGAATKGFKKRDMQKRKEIIDECDPVLVISIHQNYYPAQKYRGGQVFYRAEHAQGECLGNAIQERLNELYEQENAKPRTAMTGDYFLLNCTEAPSVIVECGFLSNAEDEKLLCDKVWKRKLVGAISSGVTSFLTETSAPFFSLCEKV